MEEQGLWLPAGVAAKLEKQQAREQGQLESMREELTLAQRQIEDMQSRKISDLGRGSGDIQEFQRIALVKRARDAFRKDPNISRAVRFIADFTFGKGISYRATNPLVQECLDLFWTDPYNREELTCTEALLNRAAELVIAGEIFLVFFDGEETVSVRSFNTEEIGDIIHSPDDYRQVRWYRRSSWNQEYDFRSDTWGMGMPKVKYWPDWKYRTWNADTQVPEDKRGTGLVYHMPIETLFGAKRGISYLCPALDWARAYKEFMEDRVSLNRSLATFAWNRKVKGGAADVAATTGLYRTNANGQKTGGVGQVYSSNEGIDFEPIKTDSGAGNARDDGYQLKLQICAAVGIMNHYFGDASQSNLATARSMELPQIRFFDSWQQRWTDTFKDIASLILERAVARGMLKIPGVTLHPIRGLVAKDRADLYVDIDFPVISWLDVLNYVQAIEASQMTTEQKLRLELVAFGFNNIDAELEAWRENSGAIQTQSQVQEAAKDTLAWVIRRYKALGKSIADWEKDTVQERIAELEKAGA
ncbi:MAG: hypothetical protein ABFD97_20255 [Syntrophobacter sp.]